MGRRAEKKRRNIIKEMKGERIRRNMVASAILCVCVSCVLWPTSITSICYYYKMSFWYSWLNYTHSQLTHQPHIHISASFIAAEEMHGTKRTRVHHKKSILRNWLRSHQQHPLTSFISFNHFLGRCWAFEPMAYSTVVAIRNWTTKEEEKMCEMNATPTSLFASTSNMFVYYNRS